MPISSPDINVGQVKGVEQVSGVAGSRRPRMCRTSDNTQQPFFGGRCQSVQPQEPIVRRFVQQRRGRTRVRDPCSPRRRLDHGSAEPRQRTANPRPCFVERLRLRGTALIVAADPTRHGAFAPRRSIVRRAIARCRAHLDSARAGPGSVRRTELARIFRFRRVSLAAHPSCARR